MINQDDYNIIRNSGGNNAKRMIIMPTMGSGSDQCDPTYSFISKLNDPYIIATVHYYSEWVYSANIGKTGFDESLYGDEDFTPRAAVDKFYNSVYDAFTAKGIGVVVGEYGLLGADSGPGANQLGEKLKYIEYMNYMATQKGFALMLWQNIIDRNDTENYSWNAPQIGAVVSAAIKGQRSSYSTDLNEIYLSSTTSKDIQIPLTLNGNTLEGIKGLTQGTDYTYDEATSTVTLSKSFVNSKFNSLSQNSYGTIADLDMQFSAGADWHQYLIKYAAPVLKQASGTTSSFSIPVDFNGAKLRRATAYDSSGARVGPNSSWWSYLECGSDFSEDYDKSVINIFNNFFKDSSVKDGMIKFTFEFYDGQKVNYILTKNCTNVTGISENSGSSSGSGGSSSGGSPTSSGNVEVEMYNSNTTSSTNGILPSFRIVNKASTPIDLSGLTLRYYFTKDGAQDNIFWCDYSSVGAGNVIGTFKTMPSAAKGADTYLEIGFAAGAGTIAAGSSIDVQARFSKVDWSSFNQSDDYSFNSTGNSYDDWNKVTAYQDGNLIWGSVPQ